MGVFPPLVKVFFAPLDCANLRNSLAV